MQIDTANHYAVNRDSDGLVRVQLARLLAVRALGAEQSLGLAAWLLVLSDPDSAVDIAGNGTRFGEVVQAVLNT